MMVEPTFESASAGALAGSDPAVLPPPEPATMDQPTKHPTYKVLTGGAAGALATAIVQAAADYGLTIKPGTQALIVLLASFVAAYMMRERP